MKHIIIVLGTALFSSLAACDEPAEEFLRALRDRQYYDVALDYLEEMESSRLASRQFKETLPFERAQLLIQSASQIRDGALLEKRLQEAEQLLTEAESRTKRPELKAKSQTNRGDLLFQRARIYLDAGSNERLKPRQKEEKFVLARQYLEKAMAAFRGAKDNYKKILDNYQLDPRDPESKSRLKRLRGIYTVVRVKLPQIIELYADTLEDGDAKRIESLNQACASFEQLWLKYPNFPAGLDSCFYGARCKYKLHEYEESLSFLQQILSLPDNSSLVARKRRALALAADCWNNISPYPFDDVIANLEPYNSKLTKKDQRNPEWQRVQMELATAYHKKSVDLKKEDPSDGRIKSLARQASKLIKSIARLPGVHRERARELVSDWNLNLAADAVVENDQPITTFAEAKQRVIDLVGQIEGLNADVADAKRNLKKNPGAQKDLDVLQERLDATAGQCLNVLDRAISLRDIETTREDLNQIRYFQSVCYLVRKEYLESALIGEFLVDHFPGVPYSKQAGAIAIRSYGAIHNSAAPENRELERGQLKQLAAKIVDRWPGSPESAEAASALTSLTLSKDELSSEDIAQAEDLMKAVGGSSIQRSILEIKLGTKLWFDYRRKKAEAADSDSGLKEQLAEAIKHLDSGVQGVSLNDIRMEAAWGSVFLVNAYLENEELDKALEQLETATLAPIDLVKQKNQVIVRSGKFDRFLSETYKIAGRCYLAAIGTFPNDESWADKALGIVQAMQARADRGDDPNMKRDVSNMYRLIALELDKQLASATDAKQQEHFINRLSQFLEALQAESDDANTIIWAGKTLMELGDSFVAQGMQEQARPLYRSAVNALDRAKSLGVSDPRLLLEIARQQAIAKRGTGKFEQAYDELVALLKKNPKSWQIQIDVAETLQLWGQSSKSSKFLAKALSGGERFQDPETKRQKNLVWGWSKLADVFKSNPKFKTPYYTSVMGAVVSRFEYGLLESKPKVMQAALKRLQIAKTRDPSMGGGSWKSKFENLELRIRAEIGATKVSAGN